MPSLKNLHHTITNFTVPFRNTQMKLKARRTAELLNTSEWNDTENVSLFFPTPEKGKESKETETLG